MQSHSYLTNYKVRLSPGQDIWYWTSGRQWTLAFWTGTVYYSPQKITSNFTVCMQRMHLVAFPRGRVVIHPPPPCPVPWALPKTRNSESLRRTPNDSPNGFGQTGNSSTKKLPKKRETPIRLQWSLTTSLNKDIKKAFVLWQIKQNNLVACKQRRCV